jgi:hypothetical protein
MQRLATLLALLLPCSAVAESNTVAVYVVAHEDDWQLFFNPSPYDDVTRPLQKVVFVHVTAGDAGQGNGLLASAREGGALQAIAFMADVVTPPGRWLAGATTINGHPIARFEYKNTVAYFLRVIDGRADGVGFPGTGHVSLERLRTGKIAQLAAVDASTTYLGWNDLVDTIEELVRFELQSTGATALRFGFPDSSAAKNPRDHSDHVSVGAAMDVVASRMPCATVARFVGHGTARLRENLSVDATAKQAAVYGVTASTTQSAGCDLCRSPWQHHRRWLGRSYFRVTRGDRSQCFDARCRSCANGRTCIDDQCACASRRTCPPGQTWDDLTCSCAN